MIQNLPYLPHTLYSRLYADVTAAFPSQEGLKPSILLYVPRVIFILSSDLLNVFWSLDS